MSILLLLVIFILKNNMSGRFLGKRETQLVILRGTTLSLYNLIDMNCYHLLSRPIFGIGRCISTLHLIGIVFNYVLSL